LTPPSIKPEPSATDASAAQTPAETPFGADAKAADQIAASEDANRLTMMSRRRAAPLTLRGARKRSAALGEGADGVEPKSGRAGGRLIGTGGPRAGIRAKARAALAEARSGSGAATESQPVAVPSPEETTDRAPSGAALRRLQLSLADIKPTTLSDNATPPSGEAGERTEFVHSAPVPAPATAPAAALRTTEPAVIDDDDDTPGGGGRRRALGLRADRRPGRGAKSGDAVNYTVAATVSPAQMRPRHYGVIALFILCVIVPTISYSWYLWTRAADQYESNVGFGSRTEEAPSTFDFLGALGGSTQSGSKDMDILNQFIISQELVAKLDAELDLKTVWSKAGNDPLNAFNSDGTIEDLVDYWQRMVLINYDNGTGLMNLRIFAFDPLDAQRIAKGVLDESTNIINVLSKTAQDDTTRYSKEALAATEQKLTEARLAVLDFQVKNNIVDPSNVVASQLSVVSTLNQQLASAQIDLDMMAGTVPETDSRLAQLKRRLDVIRNRIEEEQAKVGATSDSSSPGFAKLMADFEKLKVEQDFAQQAYLSALAAHDQALTDAQHKTRYLATYVAPTLAEAPTAPNRPLTAALTALIGFLLWSVLVLTYYALRDRR
jgi:capsular polysaccharide transport system permease protein